MRCEGPAGLAAGGDGVKLRRIAQNLLLNAVKYTRQGGIVMTWGDSEPNDPNRWRLIIQDTGPGFHADSGQPLAAMLDFSAHALTPAKAPQSAGTTNLLGSPSVANAHGTRSLRDEVGEGIGLSIVKRLCEMLDAKIELQSVKNEGTIFRIFFPRQYAD